MFFFKASPSPHKLLVTPQGVFLFETKERVSFFETLREALTSLDQKGAPFFQLYLDGFEHTLFTESLPPLKPLDRRSYLRHKGAHLLEKTPLVFMTRQKTTATFVGETWTFPASLSVWEDRLKSLRSLALQVASSFQEPTLLRLRLDQTSERLFYGVDRTLYFARTIMNHDEEAYDKTVRYIERQFHQPPEALKTLLWSREDLASFLYKKPPPGFRVLTKTKNLSPRLYFLKLALRGCTALSASLALFLGGSLFHKHHLKHTLHTHLFALEQEKNHTIQRLQSLRPIPEKVVQSFEHLVQEKADPLEDLQHFAFLNTPQTRLKGLAWERTKHRESTSPTTQITFHVCASQEESEDFGAWLQEKGALLKQGTLRVKILGDHPSESLEPSQKPPQRSQTPRDQERCFLVSLHKRESS